MSKAAFEWDPRFVDLKRELASLTSEERLTASWNDLLAELAKRTEEIARAGPDYIPQVKFADLEKLTPEEIDVIKRKGTVVIRDIVEDDVASRWKKELEDCVEANPNVLGLPFENKQFHFLYWTRPQVQARAHPNVLKATAWLSSLYQVRSGKTLDGVDVSVPLAYADRFRIRHPGGGWDHFPPHVDGGAIERWEDKSFRRCYEDIITGNWRQHDPYDLEPRLDARSSLYGRPGQATVFRSFQGWMAVSEIGPTQGTLRVFPDIYLSNSYTILRPFFRPTVPLDSPDILDPKNWKFDISTPDFPGLSPMHGGGYVGPSPTPELHPHLRIEETMISVPKVYPGDMVFWHCDEVHAVESDHAGPGDSAVMYIPAVPKTPHNSEYIAKQVPTFLAGQNPPDYEQLDEGLKLVGLGSEVDIKEPIGRVAMGLPIQVA